MTYYHGRRISEDTGKDKITYTYDNNGNQLTVKDSTGTTIRSYDELNRVILKTVPNFGTSIFTYDILVSEENGYVADKTKDPKGSETIKIYDREGRLKKVSSDGTSYTVYEYDNNGNLIAKTGEIIRKIDPKNPPTPHFGMIIPGQTDGVTEHAQELVNLYASYEYDTFNQMIKAAAGTSVESYSYNGEGLRVQKDSNGEVTRYLYEYDKVILETDNKGNTTARNTYGLNLISRNTSCITAYYYYNGHADVTSLLDSTGAVIATYYYDAFGNITEKNENEGVKNPIRYAGYQYDDGTGLYYLNSRMYDPKTARFLQEDTYSGDAKDPLSLNLYTYCHNEPIMYTDPSGHADRAESADCGSGGWTPVTIPGVTLVYGNAIDIANAKKILGDVGYMYIDTSKASRPITNFDIAKGSIIVGGVGAVGGVGGETDPSNGVLRLAGNDRDETTGKIRQYKKSNDISKSVNGDPVNSNSGTPATGEGSGGGKSIISSDEVERYIKETKLSLSDVQKNVLREGINKYANSDQLSEYVNGSDKPLIMFFEGAGSGKGVRILDDKDPNNPIRVGYQDKRYNAMCVVIKNNKIIGVYLNASTMPDVPEKPDIATIKEGVYTYYSDYYRGYAALRLNGNGKVPATYGVNRTANPESGKYTADGILIHKGYPSDKIYTPTSEGCLTLLWENDYNDFAHAVGFIIQESSVYQYDSGVLVDVTGHVVVDRSLAPWN